MSSAGQPESLDLPMEDATSVSESTDSSSMSTSDSEDASNANSIISGHPDWLQDYPESLALEMDILRPLWETYQEMHDPLDMLGRQIVSSHQEKDDAMEGHVKRETEMSREIDMMKLAVKDAETKVWTYDVEFQGMRRKIFELEATPDNLREENINSFHLEVRIDNLQGTLTEVRSINKALQMSIKNLKKAKADLLKTITGLQKQLKQEQDLKTDFQDRFNAEVVARQGNVERWLADYKIRKMKAALDAANAETAQWRKVAVDSINGHRLNRPFQMFPKDAKVIRRQSF